NQAVRTGPGRRGKNGRMAAVTRTRPVVPFDQDARDAAPGRPRERALTGHRIAAWLVDTGIVLTIQVGAFLGLASVLDRYDGFTAQVIDRYDVSRVFLDGVIGATLLIAVPLAYRVLFDRLW